MESMKTYKSTEVCEILQVTQRTLYNYIVAGQIKAFRVGREWRFTEEAVKEFMEKGTTPDYLERLAKATGKGRARK